jgi:hypothetical protein
MEPTTGIEPVSPEYKTGILPLNYVGIPLSSTVSFIFKLRRPVDSNHKPVLMGSISLAVKAHTSSGFSLHMEEGGGPDPQSRKTQQFSKLRQGHPCFTLRNLSSTVIHE